MRKKKLPVIQRVEITDIAAQGKALVRVQNYVTFVANALPGDVVDLQITRRKKSFQEARAIAFHSYSDKRTEPFCEHFAVCGGCKWQDLKYNEQLMYKEKEVTDVLSRIGKVGLPGMAPIISAEKTMFYRNKLEFTFSNNRWITRDEIKQGRRIENRNALGFHIHTKFDKVVDLRNCYLQPEPSNAIRQATRDYADNNKLAFFDLRNREGFLRNLIIRTSTTREVMVIVVFSSEDKKRREDLLDFLYQKFPEITSLQYTINPKANDSIFDLEIITYKGRDHIFEELNGLKFKIGPKSFFQTNTHQALKLYSLISKCTGLTGRETVYDLYTGTGTIANFLAHDAGKIVGIESVEEAIQDAKENSRINHIKNTDFICGDVKDVLTHEFLQKTGYPDIIITDPPRAGMHRDVIQAILSALPGKIIYVSCNPATQARDINLLSSGYKVVSVQPLDMFPHTVHVENIVLLEPK